MTHSFFAYVKVKKRLLNKIPSFRPFYRLCYNFLALFFLLIYFAALPEDTPLYRAGGSLLAVLIAVQLIALVLMIYTFKGHGSGFLGIRQIREYIQSKKSPGYLDEPERGALIKTGIYRWMRHPLYTFAIVFLVALPVMTVNTAYSIILAGIYFYAGTYFEERNLTRRFGDEYRQYQQETPRFFPKVLPILSRLAGRKNHE